MAGENQPANKPRSGCPTKCEAYSKTKPNWKAKGRQQTDRAAPVAALERQSQEFPVICESGQWVNWASRAVEAKPCGWQQPWREC